MGESLQHAKVTRRRGLARGLRRTVVGAVLVTMTAGMTAASGASAPARVGSRAGSTPTHLAFRSNGTPILNGMTFNLGNAAGSAHVGDTNVHNLVRFLQKWGANASQTNASQNATELAVAGGKLVATSGPLPTEVDAGLVAFGPNQVHLDDELLASPSIKTLADLKGKSVAYCCGASPDGVMLSAVLAKAGLKQSDIHLIATGASSSSLNALVAGQVDAAFTAAAGLPSSITSKFHSLATATELLPNYADSFMAAQPSWLKANPAEAEAIDLAWLASAKLFNGNEVSWVANAATYTSNADPVADYELAWRQLKHLNGWPLALSSFSKPQFTYNLKVAKQQAALTGSGLRPASQEANYGPWQAAWKQFSAHAHSY